VPKSRRSNSPKPGAADAHRSRRGVGTKHDASRRGPAGRRPPDGAKPGRLAVPPVGQQLTVEIGALTVAGDAVARYGQYVLFVAGGVPGEKAVIEVTSTGPRYGRARVIRVVHHSPARVEPRCRHFGVCGGCSWQQIRYEEQIRWKERLLRSTLEHHLGDRHLPIQPMIGMDDPWGTRNKVHFLLGTSGDRVTLGHYRAHSREFVPVVECPVHHAVGNRVARAAVDLLERCQIGARTEHGNGGIARHLQVRVAQATSEAQVTLVTSTAKHRGLGALGEQLPAADDAIRSVHLNVNSEPGSVVFGRHTQKLEGSDRLIEEIAGVQFLISPTAFFQTNSTGAARLVETVLRYVPSITSEPILDLYAGVGLFAAPLARRGHRVIAVEESAAAVADGIATVKHNHITGCRFIGNKVESALKKLAHAERFQVAILDPPREGCPEWALRLLARKIRPQRIIDVSCDPTTLARDLHTLIRCGYRVMEIQPIDMFPHTSHIESVAMLCQT
jgi:23S rRNA (uracil1939-C5)-methyltransferase